MSESKSTESKDYIVISTLIIVVCLMFLIIIGLCYKFKSRRFMEDINKSNEMHFINPVYSNPMRKNSNISIVDHNDRLYEMEENRNMF